MRSPVSIISILPHIDRWEDEELFPVELYRRCAAEGFLGIGGGTTEIMKEIIGKVTQF